MLVSSTAMKGVTSLSATPSSCSVLKPPPPYTSCVPLLPTNTSPVTLCGGYASQASGDGSGAAAVEEDDVKSRRRSRVCARSLVSGSGSQSAAAKTRRYKRSSAGGVVDPARRQHHHHLQLSQRQSYAGIAAAHDWTSGVDSAYLPTSLTDYAAAAACQPGSEVASCRYQTSCSVRPPPPYRHDLLAVVPSIGPGETGPAAERLKQMAAHYQRLAAATDGDGGGSGVPSSAQSYTCYDDRYSSSSYELYDEFTAAAANCQRFAVQPYCQPQQSVYLEHSHASYPPMIADVHDYLSSTCNGGAASRPVAVSSQSLYALPEPETISVPHHVTGAQFSYSSGVLARSVGYAASADAASRYMTPCMVHQLSTVTTAVQAPAGDSLYSISSKTSASSCQPVTPSAVSAPCSQTTSCLSAAERQRLPLDNDSFLEVYPPTVPAAAAVATSDTSTASGRVTVSTSSASLQLASVTTPAVSARSSWTLAAAGGECSGSTAWLTAQLDGVSTSPDVGADAASSLYGGDSTSATGARLDSNVKPTSDRELFSRQSSVGPIELY